MAKCKKCGNEVPVLLRVAIPVGQRFLGMCKPCILKELGDMGSGVVGKIKLFMSGLFK
jgi:hypothetical protein